jgi:hypothetical protein
MFWTGDNEMSYNRKRCIEQFQHVSGMKITLVTQDNLHEYILPDQPLHSGYPYLSFTHRADYLRTYFMHFYGGGYSDIKETTGSWLTHFDELQNSDKWMIGYQEVLWGVAYGPENPEIKECWADLIGNCAYICKPQTPLTQEWYNEMLLLLDKHLETLKIYPATSPIDCGEHSNGRYPIEWNEMLGRIFHRVSYKYKDRLIHTLPNPNLDWWNYH